MQTSSSTPMKSSAIYERHQTARRMEAVLLFASAVGAVTSVFVFLAHGWFLGVAVLLLSLVTFALSQLFDMMSELLGRIGRVEASIEPSHRAEEKDAS